MIRTALVSLLAGTLLATPAAAGGLKIVVGGTLPAHKPFVIGTTPLPAHTPFGSSFKPGGAPAAPAPGITLQAKGATPPSHSPGHRPHRPHRQVIVAPIVVPQPVYVVNERVYIVSAPRTCQTAGYWSYQWVPYTTTQHVWVHGAWAPDGRWIDSHWEVQPYTSGYYQPYWVPGQAYSC